MPTIFDNIENIVKEGLNKTIEKSKRADFCIGYFNLRGWTQLHEQVDKLSGDYLPEECEDDHQYFCRILIGMQRQPMEVLEEFFSKDENDVVDNARVIEYKIKLAKELREQLTIGTPHLNDQRRQTEGAGDRLPRSVNVELHLEYPL